MHTSSSSPSSPDAVVAIQAEGPRVRPPTADAGADETVAVGIPVILDGSASEGPSGVPVSYQWTLTSKPSGSTASLTGPTSALPTFTPDVAGAYTATLVVQANGVASQPDTVSITWSTGNIAPRGISQADLPQLKMRTGAGQPARLNRSRRPSF
jgi:hypothetical protein